MFKNLFWFERALRVALGAVMVILAALGSQPFLYAVGALLVVTGVFGHCPVRGVTGLSGLPAKALK